MGAGFAGRRRSTDAARGFAFPTDSHTAVLDAGLLCALLPALVAPHTNDPHAAVLRLWRARARGLEGAWAGKIGSHEAHHRFGRWGRLPHVQLNLWRIGVKGSGIAVRVPLIAPSLLSATPAPALD